MRRIAAAVASRVRLVILACIAAAVLAVLSTQVGWLLRFETSLSDAVTFLKPVAPSSSTVLVIVDEETIRTTNRYPYDRALVGQTLDQMNKAGARKVYIDAALTVAEDRAGDTALAAAMQRLGPSRLAIPVTQLSNGKLSLPLEAFQPGASIVSTNLAIDSDMRIRSLAQIEGYPTIAEWFTDRQAAATQPINFAVLPDSFTIISIRDVANGATPESAFRDKDVIIGLMVDRTKSGLAVPIHKALQRVQLLAMAVESGRMQFERLPSGPIERMVMVAVACFAAGMMMAFVPAIVGFLLFLLLAAGWIAASTVIQPGLPTQLPILPPIIALFLIWQWLGFGRSRLATTLRRRYMRVVGFGQAGLLTAIEVMADPAFVFDGTGRIVGANPPMRTILADAGLADEASIDDIFGAGAQASLLGSSGMSKRRAEIAGSSGVQHFDVNMRIVSAVGGRLGIAGLKDVTEMIDREARLKTLAYRDGLTGLSNRIAFEASLATLSEDRDQRFALLVIDLDGFKHVNDTLGHQAGDELLKGVASRLGGLLRGRDIAARLGGDEFAVILPAGGRNEGMLVAQRLLAQLKEPFAIEGSSVNVGASIGVAVWPEHTTSTETLVRLADAAMYAAKRSKPAYAVHNAKGAELFKAA